MFQIVTLHVKFDHFVTMLKDQAPEAMKKHTATKLKAMIHMHVCGAT